MSSSTASEPSYVPAHYWAEISRHKDGPGRRQVDAEIRSLIRTMAHDGWGALATHDELVKLGSVVSEITVSRYPLRRGADPDELKRWVAFLRKHKDAIAALDFFAVPTVSLKVLHGFFVIEHGRRRILRCNVTFNPTGAWVIQPLREAFPCDTAPKYLIFDRDAISISNSAIVTFMRAMGIKSRRIAYRSPWHNGVAERWVGSCRRELPEHVVVFDQRHFIRLVRSCLSYHKQDRCHLGAGQGHATRTTRYAATIGYGKSCGAATCGWIASSLGVGRSRLRHRAYDHHRPADE